MKYFTFYLFNLLAFLPIGLCLIIFTAIMGITLAASGAGFGIVLALSAFIYLYFNFTWSRKLPNRWIHFYCGIIVGILSFIMIRQMM
ncbi:hypothetical protein [Brevibacillus nitrificans]|uniref:hypothetical protein n=1 Tax=Brevibacillus nitrificans TaxID=651560 RepID=UPI00261ABD09|nr:hypothetical protein [Brevibacillus nitrificans]